MQLVQKDEATAANRRIYFFARNQVNPWVGLTGLSFAAADIQVSKDGGAEGNSAGSVTEIGGGTYYYEATAGELDTLGPLQLRLAKSGVVVESHVVQVVGWKSGLEKSAGDAGVVQGAAVAGTLSGTQMTTDLAEATDDHYIGRSIVWTSGNLKGQATDITDYAGSTKMLTFTTVTEAPIAGDNFIIV